MRRLAAAAIAVAAGVAALAHGPGADGLEPGAEAKARTAPPPRVQRYPLAAFRSERPGRVQSEGAWWPEWAHLPEGLRSAVVGEPGGRLRFRVAAYAGARFDGRIEARPQIAGDAGARARCMMRLDSAGRSTLLFDQTLAPGPLVPFALDLPSDLAEDAALELAVEPVSGSLANAAWIGAALTRTLPRDPAPGPHMPSIVLITADTVRQDELGPYGGPTRTPALDRLAAAGITFLDVHSVAFGTAPSHASLFTSSPASEHGVFDNATVLGASSETLAEVLAASGYSTAAFVSSSTLARSLGFDQGFDDYRDVFARDPAAGSAPPNYHERSGGITVTRFLDWLQIHAGEPFFAWIHLYDAHQPYLPPDGWADPYLPAGGGAVAGLAYPRSADGSPVYLRPAALRVGGAARLQALAPLARAEYRGEIAYLDSQVAKVLDALARYGQGDAIVVFTADHGENFLEHGPELAFGHAGLHAEVSRLPLVVSAPGSAGSGERRGGLAANLDIAPTVLALAGIAAPRRWRGRSLLGPNSGAAREALVLEGAEREEIAVRTSRWLLSVKAPAVDAADEASTWTLPGARISLYDLAADPGEKLDVYRSGDPAAASLLTLVEPFRAPPRAADILDSELHAEALRALGYAR